MGVVVGRPGGGRARRAPRRRLGRRRAPGPVGVAGAARAPGLGTAPGGRARARRRRAPAVQRDRRVLAGRHRVRPAPPARPRRPAGAPAAAVDERDRGRARGLPGLRARRGVDLERQQPREPRDAVVQRPGRGPVRRGALRPGPGRPDDVVAHGRPGRGRRAGRGPPRVRLLDVADGGRRRRAAHDDVDRARRVRPADGRPADQRRGRAAPAGRDGERPARRSGARARVARLRRHRARRRRATPGTRTGASSPSASPSPVPSRPPAPGCR